MNFDTNPGIYFTEEERIEITELSDEELCERIELSDVWESELCEEVCGRAGLLTAYLAADGEHFEEIVYMSIDILKENAEVRRREYE
jgi:hypothetical protein